MWLGTFLREPRTGRHPPALIRLVREIDCWLASKPLDFGESRFETVRLGVVHPLAVLEEPPTVIVLDIWRF